VALYYADASALVKLIVSQPETAPLHAFLDGADLVSSEIVLAEVPRAVRRVAARLPGAQLDAILEVAGRVIETVALAPLDRAVVLAAGALGEPWLRALDAIHVATAVGLLPLGGFVTYDERQAAGARLAGLRTMSPGRRA
jgi:predicted nucleic acid-binding protein